MILGKYNVAQYEITLTFTKILLALTCLVRLKLQNI